MNAEEYRAAIHRITEDVKNAFPVRKKVKFRSRKQHTQTTTETSSFEVIVSDQRFRWVAWIGTLIGLVYTIAMMCLGFSVKGQIVAILVTVFGFVYFSVELYKAR